MENSWIIKTLFNINKSTYIFILISFLCGYFKKVIIYMFLIIVHELGHVLTALLFGWKISKINIYPLGGLTVFNGEINKPFVEELVVTIMGPLFQMIAFLLFFKNNYDAFVFNNYLLLFNLLPIVPLDGGKLLSIFLELLIYYKKSLYIVVYLSFIIFFYFLFLMFKLNNIFFLVAFFFLLFKIIDEKNNINYYYNRFLLERLFRNYNYKKKSIVPNINCFYKYRNNSIIENKEILFEKDILKDYFR